MARTEKHRRFVESAKKAGEYERLVARHGSETCFACGAPPKKRRLNVDHDHKLMQVRGLLCFSCNKLLEDWVTAPRLRALADYLDAFHAGYDAMIAEKRAA